MSLHMCHPRPVNGYRGGSRGRAPSPALSAMPKQFLLKDVVLLGAALHTAGAALGA